jgi:hypothetical protein
MIIVPNFHWWTFRYWDVRATDACGIGSSPKGKWSFCTDFNLPSTKLHHIDINKLLLIINIRSPFIKHSQHYVSPLLSVPYIKNNISKHQKERHVTSKPLYKMAAADFVHFLCEGIVRQKHCPYLLYCYYCIRFPADVLAASHGRAGGGRQPHSSSP